MVELVTMAGMVIVKGGNGDNDGGSDGNDGGSEGNYEIPEFMGQSGCTLSQTTKKSPLEFLGLLVTDEILEGIVEQTNFVR